ncbi:hypothetical protein KQX54_006511 [Cotesia glomerata]|uniref:Uncharacterized protein n=1 Tax=Cotesia glomerata TaxID=32391 RepID=A0AAV7HSM6_COTGL|nr:hypothetical protein KQX54_006511 [Cotesia glomerata]
MMLVHTHPHTTYTYTPKNWLSSFVSGTDLRNLRHRHMAVLGLLTGVHDSSKVVNHFWVPLYSFRGRDPPENRFLRVSNTQHMLACIIFANADTYLQIRCCDDDAKNLRQLAMEKQISMNDCCWRNAKIPNDSRVFDGEW